MNLFSRLLRLVSRQRATPAPPPATAFEPAVTGPATAPEPRSDPVAPLPEPTPAAVAPATAPVEPIAPSKPPSPEPEPEEGNEDGEELAEADEEDLDDPLSGSGEPLEISLPTAETVAAGRREAELLALSGPQKVTLTDPAGPGSLAETLAHLEAEGRLTSEILDDPETGPYILYRPIS